MLARLVINKGYIKPVGRSFSRPLSSYPRKISKEMASEGSPCRVLSIQSHVVSGYVGNKAAVFPMQVLGFDVDFVNSVQFSNHTGYPNKLKGTVLSGAELVALSAGLSDNYLLDYDYLLTGYIGSETFLNSVLEILDTIQRANPQLKYVCDPVLGDHHKYYVPVALVDIFKAKLIPRAYMITPNQFEAELLTGMKIQCEEDAVKALIQLHSLGPQVVVLTSAEFAASTSGSESAGEVSNNNSNSESADSSSSSSSSSSSGSSASLHCYILYPADTADTADTADINGSSCSDGTTTNTNTNAAGQLMVTKIEVNKVAGNYTGTGDAMAALLLSWTHLLQQQQQQQQQNKEQGSSNSSCTSTCGDVGSDSGSGLGANPFSGALCNALATVKAMIERSSARVRQHNAQLIASGLDESSGIGIGGSGDSSAAGGEDGNRQHCALVRARELQVVQSKRDIETPPVQALNCISHRTWRVL